MIWGLMKSQKVEGHCAHYILNPVAHGQINLLLCETEFQFLGQAVPFSHKVKYFKYFLDIKL